MTEDGSPPKPKASVPPPPPTASRPPPPVPPPSVRPPPPSQPPPPPFRPATQPFSPDMIVHDSGKDPDSDHGMDLEPATQPMMPAHMGNKTIQGQPVPPEVFAGIASASSTSSASTSQPPLGGAAMQVESQPIQLPQTAAAAAFTEALGNFDGDAFKNLARAFVDFNFDEIVTRSLAKVLYALSWIEAVAVLLMGWYNAVVGLVNGAIGVGLAMLILAPLGALGVLILARIICELLILAVSSHEALQDVRAALKE